MRNVLDDDDAIYSDPEDGDSDFLGQVTNTDKELLMMHRGNLPKEKKENDESFSQKKQQSMRNAHSQKYATQTGSPNRTRRRPQVASGLYDLDIKKLEDAISKLKPKVVRENPCFQSPSRENLFSLHQKTKVAPPATKYRPVDPKKDTSVIVKID